ncbi:hypothetical protein AC1031_009322 [Aphanomyces cochlioides]|nr:hypothetical protein AC1031_009322 [Aphanomyces cochlioides]
MTTTLLSTKVAACCDTLSLQEAWVFAKKPQLKAVRDAFEETPCESNETIVVDSLLPLAAPMAENLLPSWHTDTIQTTCALLVMFVTVLGVYFRPFADQVVVPLLNAGRKMRRRTMEERVANPNLSEWKLVDQMLWQSVETCLDMMSSKSRYDLLPILDYYDACHSVSVQCLILRQVDIRMAARGAFSNFCHTWSEHMDELAHIPPPHIRNLLVDCYTRHDITTTNGPTSAVVDMVQDIMVEEEDTQDVVEDKDVVGRVDDVLDVHLSLVMYLLVFLTTSLWSLSLLVGGLLWPVGISTKTKVVPIPSVDLLCEDQRSRDTSDPKKDHSTMWGEAKDDPASVGSV